MLVLHLWHSFLSCLLFLFATCVSQDNNLDLVCGKQVPVTTDIGGYRRDYVYYYPSILCDQTKLKSFLLNHTNVDNLDFFDFSTPDQSQQFSLPLVLAIHGFTDNPIRFDSHWHWSSYAEKYGFILLSPQGGVNNAATPSWNAQSCCGDNLAKNIDDVGFIRQLIVDFLLATSKLFPFLDLTFDSLDPALTLFITGHSNGAFMSDKLAWTYATGLKQTNTDGQLQTRFNIPITAVAPVSGFIYNPTEFGYGPNSISHNNVSIFFNHGTGDVGVDDKGCGCDGSKCCCGIREAALARMKNASDTSWCKSVSDEMIRWGDWNNNNKLTTTGSEKVDSFGQYAVRRCVWDETKPNSRVLTGVCKWDHAGHNVNADKYVDFDILRDSIMDFFLHSKCIRQGFVWDADKKSCIIKTSDGVEVGPNQYYQLITKTLEQSAKSLESVESVESVESLERNESVRLNRNISKIMKDVQEVNVNGTKNVVNGSNGKVFKTTPWDIYQTTPWDIYYPGIINSTVDEGEGKTGVAAIHHKIMSHIPKAKIDFLQMTLLVMAYATSLFLIIFACIKTSQLEGEGFCACCCC